MTERNERYDAFLDDLAPVVDGDPAALDRHADFLVDDDEARDLRHEAGETAKELALAGADFAMPADFEAKLLAAIDAGVGEDAGGRTTSPGFSSPDLPSEAEAQSQPAEASAPSSSHTQPAPLVGAGTQPPEAEHAWPAHDERAHGQPAEGQPTQSQPVKGQPAQGRSTQGQPAQGHSTQGQPAQGHSTQGHSTQGHSTQGQAAHTPASQPGVVGHRTQPVGTYPTGSPGATPEAQPSAKKKPSRGKLLIFPIVGAVALAAAAAAAAGLFFWSQTDEAGPPEPTLATRGIGGTLELIDRAADDGQSGVSIRRLGEDDFVALGADEGIAPGSVLRTDERTRARVALEDGSELVLNHATELELVGDSPRSFRLRDGDIVADIAHLDGAPNASFATQTGRVEVLGTKFQLSANEDVTSVRVSRGVVSVSGNDGQATQVRAGEEGLVAAGEAPSVAPVPGLANTLAWSELGATAETDDHDTIAGIGSLRARRPGHSDEPERALTVASQQVRVRIVGNVARTEVEQVFRNDSDQRLEGIYRFPLPADAQIARLALDVEGRMEEGSFVERDRAARIWRGVRRNATPRAQRQPDEEFIWVPGPWVDPAILEWQRGGQFELRIFPIPAHGERRVILGYTQTVQPHGARRRYVYPLAHSADDSTRVERFDVDVRVAGAEHVSARGYHVISAAEEDATRLTLSEEGFSPKGDLSIDYRLPGGEQELRWWTYRGEAAAAPPENSREQDREVLNLQREIAEDDRPYVTFALRPELPRETERRERDYVLVVDASQSMVGERFDRASGLASHVVSEMDRRDRFTVLVCDYRCQQMPGGLRAPGAAASQEAREWLEGMEPAGASDLVASLREAAATVSADRRDDRELHLVYVGDGISSTGYRRAASLAAEMEQLASAEHVAISTVGIGGDADTMALGAIARSAGGHYVPYVPGQRISVAALSILETTYGASLESPRVEMPDGLSEVAPAALPTVRAGQELIVVARMERDHVTGPLTLRGTVAGRPFERSYDVDLTPTESAGNLFVPRLWAAGQIERMQLDGRGEHRGRIIAMSKAYGVMSRHTSLLVLESEAMFRAFRVDRNTSPVAQWTGEEDVVGGGTESAGEDQRAGVVGALADGISGSGSGFGRSAGGMGGGGGGAPGMSRRARNRGPVAATPRQMAPSMDRDDSMVTRAEAERRAPVEPAAPPARQAEEASGATSLPNDLPTARPMPRRRPGRWMRRVRVRVGQIQRRDEPSRAEERRAEEAQERLRENPDSRDRHRDAVRRLSRAGQLERALEITEDWIARDRLDPEALTAKADLLGRMGRRDEALRLLTGTVDLVPESESLHTRLARAFDRIGQPERACAHRIALAEIDESDVDAVADAMRCERALGRDDAAQRILMSVREARVRTRAEREAEDEDRSRRFRGDFTIDADWSGGGEVDLSVISPQGTRLSWMGGRTTVVGEHASEPGRERLGLRWTGVGTYLVEVSRTDTSDTTPIRGQLRVRILGERQTIPFTLEGSHARVARVRVTRTTRLEPVTGTVGPQGR